MVRAGLRRFLKRFKKNQDGDDVEAEHEVNGIKTCNYTPGISRSQEESDRIDEYRKLMGRRR